MFIDAFCSFSLWELLYSLSCRFVHIDSVSPKKYPYNNRIISIEGTLFWGLNVQYNIQGVPKKTKTIEITDNNLIVRI
jgi:hypothetical protein